MRRIERSGPGFTLVEIMVVVFIILMLMAMLLPALAQGIEGARRATCASNLHQIGVAVMGYRTNNGDWFFPATYPTRPNGTTSWYFGETDANGVLNPTKGYLVPYLEKGYTVERCPSWREGDFRMRFQEPGWGYAYNYYYLGQNGEAYTYTWQGQVFTVPRDIHGGHSIKQPTQTVLFADSARVNYFQSGATPENPVVEENFFLEPPSQNFDSVHFRHNDRANVLFVDGHVEPKGALRWFTADGVDTQFSVTKKIGNLGIDDTLYDRE